MPFINVKGKGGKPVRAAVQFGSNEVGEMENILTEVNSLQTAEQRRVTENLLVDKVLNGGLRLQLKVLVKVLPLLKKTPLENFTREMQTVLNESQLTDSSLARAHSMLEKKLNSAELLKKAKIVEQSKINTMLSRNKMQEKVNCLSHAVSEPRSRLADLFEVLTLLTAFCKNIFVHLKIIVERKTITAKVFEVAASIIKQLINWKISLPKHLVENFKCAKLFYEFNTGFYVDYFRSFFIDGGYVFHTRAVDHLQELASWFELYISLLVKLSGLISKLNGGTSLDEWQELYHCFLSEQVKKFLEFKFSDPPCKNEDFALQLIYIVNNLIEDVSLDIGVVLKTL